MTKSEQIKPDQSEKNLAVQLKPTHQDDVDDEDENVKQLGDCAALYLSLQDCLVETNRDWKACQTKIQALKACNQNRMINQQKQ